MKKLLLLLLCFSSLSSGFSQTLYDLISGSNDHKTLKTAIDLAGLETDLSGSTQLTVFAPTDAAFANLAPGLLDALIQDPKGALKEVLLYHLIPGLARSSDLSDGQTIGTLNIGKKVQVSVGQGGIKINGAGVSQADLEASNGILHVVDGVLIPKASIYEIVSTSPDHKTLHTALLAANLDEALDQDGPFTLFAPTDEAFEALPDGVLDALLADPNGALKNILLYHVLPGTYPSTSLSDDQEIVTLLAGKHIRITINTAGIFIDGAQVSMEDIEASNGVLHVIRAVLIPRPSLSEIVESSPDHLTLNAAIGLAGLKDTLSTSGPFTLFAPTDAAIALLPDSLLSALLADPTGALRDFLLNHISNGELASFGLTDGLSFTTLLPGQFLRVRMDSLGIIINNARIQLSDIPASNGILHVLDAVLLPQPSISDIVASSPDHRILNSALSLAGLTETLDQDGLFTLFAPTDAAFEALPDGVLDALLADPQGALKDILLYHALPGEYRSSDLEDKQEILTLLNGKHVRITINTSGVFIDGAQVSMQDIQASNGIVHVIRAVLLPRPSLAEIVQNSADHETLEAAIELAGLKETLSNDGPFTLFAPTDSAFEALPQGVLDSLLADPSGALKNILLYHVLPGETASFDLTNNQILEPLLMGENLIVRIDSSGIFIGDAKVTVADIPAANGILHVIDAVLVPKPKPTLAEIIASSPIHNTLELALDLAGLTPVLNDEGAYTVFAPTDAAFEALPDGVLDALLADPNGALKNVLLYHAANGIYRSSDLTDQQEIQTLLAGKHVRITINTSGVFIDGAQVSMEDVQASNGIMHVIRAVLLPRSSIAELIEASPDHKTLNTAVGAAGLKDVLNTGGPFTVFAPTDAAFQALPAGLLDSLLADPNGALRNLLFYHTSEGETESFDLTNGLEIQTLLLGKNLKVTIDSSGIFINNARVIMADIAASNGIIHIIDAVLIPETAKPNIVDIIENSPVHTILNNAIELAGLKPVIRTAGPITVFAPTDAAFRSLAPGVLDALLNDPTGALRDLLLYHAIPGNRPSGSLVNGQNEITLKGDPINVTINSEGVFINNAKVIQADIEADNGIVHVLDGVLSLPSSTSDFSGQKPAVWPNPFTNGFFLDQNQINGTIRSVEILNAEGKTIYRTEHIQTSQEITPWIQPGLYLLRIHTNKSTESVKIIKSN